MISLNEDGLSNGVSRDPLRRSRMAILAIKVFFFKWRLRNLTMTNPTQTKIKKFNFFKYFFLFLSDLNYSICRCFIYVLVKIPHCASAKNRKFWTTRSTNDPKNFKFSQYYVQPWLSTHYFFHHNRWGTATKKIN
jgi:hypothetical protein